jgi:hypothetical protein
MTEKKAKKRKEKKRKKWKACLCGSEKAHNVTVVSPSGGFSSVPADSKREGSMTCTREDSPVGMQLNINGLTGDQVHISGYSGVGYDAAC